MKKTIIFLSIAIILVVVFVFIKSDGGVKSPEGSPVPTPTPTPTATSTPESVSENVIMYSDSGYAPSTLTIKVGELVTFKNAGSKMMWTASAMHPSHKAYPGTDIALCGTQMMVPMFDACKGYGQGESWMFKFNQRGTWKYHNHMEINHYGTIVVE
ncbi:MAG: hypothetical protein AAB799_00405 [Patescibacteria group bacterium]